MSTTTKEITACLLDESVFELNVTFDCEISKDIPADRHPDDPSGFMETTHQCTEIKSIDVVLYGIGIDVTQQFLADPQYSPMKSRKMIADLEAYAANMDDEE